MRHEITAGRAWAGIGAAVLAYELLAPEGQLLSEGVDRALERHPILVRAAIGATALHLLNLLPEKIDPFHQLTKTCLGVHDASLQRTS